MRGRLTLKTRDMDMPHFQIRRLRPKQSGTAHQLQKLTPQLPSPNSSTPNSTPPYPKAGQRPYPLSFAKTSSFKTNGPPTISLLKMQLATGPVWLTTISPRPEKPTENN